MWKHTWWKEPLFLVHLNCYCVLHFIRGHCFVEVVISCHQCHQWMERLLKNRVFSTLNKYEQIIFPFLTVRFYPILPLTNIHRPSEQYSRPVWLDDIGVIRPITFGDYHNPFFGNPHDIPICEFIPILFAWYSHYITVGENHIFELCAFPGKRRGPSQNRWGTQSTLAVEQVKNQT